MCISVEGLRCPGPLGLPVLLHWLDQRPALTTSGSCLSTDRCRLGEWNATDSARLSLGSETLTTVVSSSKERDTRTLSEIACRIELNGSTSRRIDPPRTEEGLLTIIRKHGFGVTCQHESHSKLDFSLSLWKLPRRNYATKVQCSMHGPCSDHVIRALLANGHWSPTPTRHFQCQISAIG